MLTEPVLIPAGAVCVGHDQGLLEYAYSATGVATGRVRRVFAHDGRLWAVIGLRRTQAGVEIISVIELVPETAYSPQASAREALARGLAPPRACLYDGKTIIHHGERLRATDRMALWIGAVDIAGLRGAPSWL